MLTLSKTLLPMLFMAVVAIVGSFFTEYAWTLPLMTLPFYCDPFGGLMVDKSMSVSAGVAGTMFEDLCMRPVPMYSGWQSKCGGTISRYIVLGGAKGKNNLGISAAHEIAHLYYKHPLLNVIYMWVVVIMVSIAIKMFGASSVLLLLIIVPLTNYKTLLLEVSADRLANKFVNMESLLDSQNDSWFKSKRLKAING